VRVIFQNILFKNNTGLDIPLTIESPIGTCVYGPKDVSGNTSVDIPIVRDNCTSVRLIVSDPDHGATQDFVLAPSAKGRHVYLEAVEVQFDVGDITGTARTRTGDF
jgi:hypothetical protein